MYITSECLLERCRMRHSFSTFSQRIYSQVVQFTLPLEMLVSESYDLLVTCTIMHIVALEMSIFVLLSHILLDLPFFLNFLIIHFMCSINL